MQLFRVINRTKSSRNLLLSFRCSSSATIRLQDLLREPSKSFVLVSKSTNIFENLALEDWLYTHSQLRVGISGFLLWVNDPCIVIGRHQNPWTECNLDACARNKVAVVRRNSGGGTVYHDQGNLNLCFLTTKKEYNRTANLQFMSDVLKKYYSIDCEITKREDIVLRENQCKISGTASKLASKAAYHHCTLLVNVDLQLLRASIRRERHENIISKATESVKSPVQNLYSHRQTIVMHDLIANLIKEYGETYFTDAPILVNPCEEAFAGFNEILRNLQSWDWIYGRTPRFIVNTECTVEGVEYKISLNIYHGLVEKCLVVHQLAETELTALKGTIFDVKLISEALNLCNDLSGNSAVHQAVSKAIVASVEKTFE